MRAFVICGPTASGKTEFAHKLALKINGEIVNADSRQLYKQLPIITASPLHEQKQELQYYLYNFLDISQDFSVTKYVQSASYTVQEINSKGKIPIIVGGSGMYIGSLIYGYNEIPEISQEVRQYTRNIREQIGAVKFFQKLKILDPEICKMLNVQDTQRTLRAYEVIKQTGNSILQYKNTSLIKPLAECDFKIVFLLPDRQFLYSTCNFRLNRMFNKGAIEEVENAYNLFGSSKTSAMKALGVQEIIAYLQEKIQKEEAIELASTKTRQYAKRQITWFTHQIQNKEIIRFKDLDEYKTATDYYLYNQLLRD